MPVYLTPDQLCDLIPGTTKGYWAQLRFQGRGGPAYVKPSAKKVLYRQDVVISWLESLERTGTAA